MGRGFDRPCIPIPVIVYLIPPHSLLISASASLRVARRLPHISVDSPIHTTVMCDGPEASGPTHSAEAVLPVHTHQELVNSGDVVDVPQVHLASQSPHPPATAQTAAMPEPDPTTTSMPEPQPTSLATSPQASTALDVPTIESSPQPQPAARRPTGLAADDEVYPISDSIHPIPEGDDAVLTMDQIRWLGRFWPFPEPVRCSLTVNNVACNAIIETADKMDRVS